MLTEAPGIFLNHKIGKIAKGYKADLVFFKKSLATTPLVDIFTHLIFSFSSQDVENVMIDGRWVLWKNNSPFINEKELDGLFMSKMMIP